MRRVAVTGMGGITALGSSYKEIRSNMKAQRNATKLMTQWSKYKGLTSQIAAPVTDFDRPAEYTRKQTRSMGRVALFSTRATEFALKDAGLTGDPILTSGETGIAYGSCAGAADAIVDFGGMILNNDTSDITATTFVRMMPQTTAVNTGLFFGIRGRLIPTSSACTSGSQAIGYAYESILSGAATVMIAGGAEELTAAHTAVFDTLFSASRNNEHPNLTPAPFDKNRDGLVVGEGGATLILEEWEHAKARGAKIYAELIGFATNCDATHITAPNAETIGICIEKALRSANIPASEIGYISAHGTATTRGDIAESQATSKVMGNKIPISSMKSYLGHTLGACGSIEAWLAIEMMREDSFAPTLNLNNPDPECGDLDYIQHEWRNLNTEYIMSNNFAFGGVNTSLIFKR